ncbi:CAP domain-containing protein [Streptomyces sp. CA-250714]|uniref:CAP domain-containing protein n=1 Tax=Streptomyces sp. CA-250714 TaxID=3240060 RepID=UPI003D8ECC64
MEFAFSRFAGRGAAVGLALGLVTATGWEAAAMSTHAEVLALVNAERARAGCPVVTERGALRRAAQKHSVRMARSHRLSHTAPGSSGPGRRVAAQGYRFQRVGENLARGQWNAAQVVRAWMRSPKHRAALTNCAYRHAGVGVSNRPGGPWWTLLLASKRK